LSLSAPGANNTGNVNLEFQVDSWLRYDWDNNPVTADTNPTSVAHFGQLRGHDKIIYWREVSN
jgi:MSHA biogenesis protein MshQ